MKCVNAGNVKNSGGGDGDEVANIYRGTIGAHPVGEAVSGNVAGEVVALCSKVPEMLSERG